MHDPCKSVLSVVLYLFVAFCVFLWLTILPQANIFLATKKASSRLPFPFFLPSFPAIFLFAFGKYYFAGKTERAGSKKKKINPLKCIRKLNPSGNLLVAVEQHFLCLQSLFIIDISPDQVAQVQAGGGSGFLDDAVVFVILKHNIRQ